MEILLFKTKKLAAQYVRDNYPEHEYSLRNSYITEKSDYDDVDMPNLQWQGETPAWDICDSNGQIVGAVAWWEDGDNVYELTVGGKPAGTFDNNYDAREAYCKAVETEEYKDEDEEEVFEVKLLCNGEDISN